MTHNVPTERVLSTLNTDGTRHWIKPKLAHGRFLRRRRTVGYALIALFVLLPRLRIGGRPALLIDFGGPELDLLGLVFRPSDGFSLALLGVTIVSAVFLLTAVWGRVWCGWGCPQTVYLELVFRPIERWFERSRGQRASRMRKALKWVVFTAVAFAVANVFLAYFVGTDRLERWVIGSPLAHPGGFAVVLGVSALVLFDLGWFREQMCIVACPYGRLQSVLLDRQSLVIGYDGKRGEPRAKPKKKLPVLSAGDCVDCTACVSVCPTGIDIRNGLQMECIGCAQCIDACDAVMTKLDRPRGLIRYTSQDELAGRPQHVLRARTIVYPLLLALAGGALFWTIERRTGSEIMVGRAQGPSFVVLPDGGISAQVRLRIENTSDTQRRYFLALAEAPDATLRSQPRYQLGPHRKLDLSVFIDVPRASFVRGQRRVYLRIHDSGGIERVLPVTLLGPEGDSR